MFMFKFHTYISATKSQGLYTLSSSRKNVLFEQIVGSWKYKKKKKQIKWFF